MRDFSKRSANFALWRTNGYVLLMIAILTAGFAPSVSAATWQTGSAAQQKAGTTPVRNALTGNAVTFASTNNITVGQNSTASPYPATLDVSGITGSISGLTVTLYNFKYIYSSFVDVLLVAPGGQKTILMARVGEGSISNANLTFDDNATSFIGDTGFNTGSYKPKIGGLNYSPTFASPAPAGPYSATLSVFNNIVPNGTWQLYVANSLLTPGTAGYIGGWSIDFYVNQATVSATDGSGQKAKVGITYAKPLQATVKDSAGSPVVGAPVTFTVVSNSNGAGGTFSSGATTYTATTNAQGVVTSTSLTANNVSGNFLVRATTSDSSLPSYFLLLNQSGAATSVAVFGGNSQAAAVGTRFSQGLQILVVDSYNNPVVDTLVTFAVPSSGASATFFGSSVYNGYTDLSGVATSYPPTANSIIGSYSITATTSGVVTPAVFTLTNLSTIISAQSGSNQQAPINNYFSKKFVAKVVDTNNNPAVNASVTFTAPSSGASGTFANGATSFSTTTDSSGTAIPLFFMANSITGTYVVTATTTGATNIVSFTLTNAPPDIIQFSSASYTATETNGSAVVTLTRSGTGVTPVLANLVITNVTTSNADYTLTNNSSSLDTTFDPGTGTATKETYKAIVLASGKILLAGAFTTYNDQAVRGIVRLNADGSLDSSFGSVTGGGTNETVHGMVTQPDGKILIVGGSFTTYNGISRTRIARLNADGSLDTTFDPGTSANNAIFRVAVQPDGKILIGGSFTIFNGITRSRIARLNADGSVDTTFAATGAGANSTVWNITLQPDGKILIGGDFTSYNGVATKKLARLNSDGTLDTTFTSVTVGASSTVWDTALQPDGKIIIAGDFTSYNNVSVGYIARLNGTDGSLDSSFLGGGAGADNTIRALAFQNDGKLLFAGGFSFFNGVSVNRIGRLNTDGTFDTTIVNIGAGPNNLIWTIAPQPDNAFIVGGDLTTYDGVSRNHVARASGYAVYWADGDTAPKTFTIPLVRDNVAEGPEQLTIGLSNIRSSGTAGQQATAQVTILDGEPLALASKSGNGQTGYLNTAFGQPLVVSVRDVVNYPVSSVVVTFTAPASGASGSFANGTRIYTGTTDASGLVTTSVFTANAITGTYSVNVIAQGVTNTVSFTLTNAVVPCNPFVVTAISDNGQATTCGTFSYALASATSGTSITFILTQGNIVTFTGSLTPNVPAGVTISGGANGVTLNGNGVSGDGLRLSGNNTLSDLTVRRFAGREIVTLGTGNRLVRVHAEN